MMVAPWLCVYGHEESVVFVKSVHGSACLFVLSLSFFASYRRMVMLPLQLDAPRHQVEEGPQAHAAHRRGRLDVAASVAVRALFGYVYMYMMMRIYVEPTRRKGKLAVPPRPPTWWRSAPKMAHPVRTPVAQRRAWACGPKAWFTSCLAVAITSSSSAAGTTAEPVP